MKLLGEHGPCPEHRYSFVNVRRRLNGGTARQVVVDQVPAGPDGIDVGAEPVPAGVDGSPRGGHHYLDAEQEN
jgi:hypothetical protein